MKKKPLLYFFIFIISLSCTHQKVKPNISYQIEKPKKIKNKNIDYQLSKKLRPIFESQDHMADFNKSYHWFFKRTSL